jgi:hypothetical protein
VERVTGIEPASRAWEPYNDALIQALTCGQLWSGVTPIDRTDPVLWHACGTTVGLGPRPREP